MVSSRLVCLAAALLIAAALTGCATPREQVTVSVRTQNNAISVEDSQRIHINGERVALREVADHIRCIGVREETPIRLEVAWKCSPQLLGEVVEELLSTGQSRAVLIERGLE
jgi:hypothetical protein